MTLGTALAEALQDNTSLQTFHRPGAHCMLKAGWPRRSRCSGSFRCPGEEAGLGSKHLPPGKPTMPEDEPGRAWPEAIKHSASVHWLIQLRAFQGQREKRELCLSNTLPGAVTAPSQDYWRTGLRSTQ